MKISVEKTKLMTNTTIGINREIKINRQKLGTVTPFYWLIGSHEDSKTESSLEDSTRQKNPNKVEDNLESKQDTYW